MIWRPFFDRFRRLGIGAPLPQAVTAGGAPAGEPLQVLRERLGTQNRSTGLALLALLADDAADEPSRRIDARAVAAWLVARDPAVPAALYDELDRRNLEPSEQLRMLRAKRSAAARALLELDRALGEPTGAAGAKRALATLVTKEAEAWRLEAQVCAEAGLAPHEAGRGPTGDPEAAAWARRWLAAPAVVDTLLDGVQAAISGGTAPGYPDTAPWARLLGAVRLEAPVAHEKCESPSDNLVISLQRSGLNWLRYGVEKITGLRTPGTPRLVTGGEVVAFHRTHDALARAPYGHPLLAPLFDRDGRALYRRCLLLLRDPIESYVRQAERDMTRLLPLVHNLQAFDAFSGDKLVLSYEELITGPEPLWRAIEFLRLPIVEPEFDFAKEQRVSMDLYRDFDGEHMGNRSWVEGQGFDPRFYSRRVDRDEVERLAGYLSALSPQAYAGHLESYFEAYLQRGPESR